jgi:hypothetical protein
MLHAHVHCDCFEQGRIKSAPPYSALVYVGDDGALDVRSESGAVHADVYYWREKACEHERGIMLSHCIGNISLVAALRMELERHAEWFPVLLQQTVYNGIHAGDFLTLEDVRRVKEELRKLDGYECVDPENHAFINAFRRKMSELIECALALNKPIVF